MTAAMLTHVAARTRSKRAVVDQQRRFEAMERFLAEYAPGFRLSDSARASIEAEWSAPLEPQRSKGRRT